MNQSSSHTDKWKQVLDASLEKGTADKMSIEEQEMMQEAIEGLSSLDNDAALNNSVSAINNALQVQIKKRKKQLPKRRNSLDQGKVWIVTIVLLVLICIAFLYILKIQ